MVEQYWMWVMWVTGLVTGYLIRNALFHMSKAKQRTGSDTSHG